MHLPWEANARRDQAESERVVRRGLLRMLRPPRHLLWLPLGLTVVLGAALSSMVPTMLAQSYSSYAGGFSNYEMERVVLWIFAACYAGILTLSSWRLAESLSSSTRTGAALAELKLTLITPQKVLEALLRSSVPMLWLAGMAYPLIAAMYSLTQALSSGQSGYPETTDVVLLRLSYFLLGHLLTALLGALLWLLITVVLLSRIPARLRVFICVAGAAGLTWGNLPFVTQGHLISDLPGMIFCAAIVLVPSLLFLFFLGQPPKADIGGTVLLLISALAFVLVAYVNFPSSIDPDSDGCLVATQALSPWNSVATQVSYLEGDDEDAWDFYLPTLAAQTLWLAALWPLALGALGPTRRAS